MSRLNPNKCLLCGFCGGQVHCDCPAPCPTCYYSPTFSIKTGNPQVLHLHAKPQNHSFPEPSCPRPDTKRPPPFFFWFGRIASRTSRPGQTFGAVRHVEHSMFRRVGGYEEHWHWEHCRIYCHLTLPYLTLNLLSVNTYYLLLPYSTPSSVANELIKPQEVSPVWVLWRSGPRRLGRTMSDSYYSPTLSIKTGNPQVLHLHANPQNHSFS